MKYLVFSDIHGSVDYMKKMEEMIYKENPDKIILLGDLYYHGPRNPLPDKYNPMDVAHILNKHKEKLLVCKGNCDAEVDQMISDFPLQESITLNLNGLKIFCSHGHKFNIDHLPEEDFDIMLYGHFHVGFINAKNIKLFASPGSITLPKEDSKHTYLMLEDNKITLKEINGNIIEEKTIN